MAFFERERELCELFIKNSKRNHAKFTYNISAKAVSICVCYEKKADWSNSDGERYLNRLWRNFNLAFIGFRDRCLVLKYNRKKNYFRDYFTEYLFPMLHFNMENFYSLEF